VTVDKVLASVGDITHELSRVTQQGGSSTVISFTPLCMSGELVNALSLLCAENELLCKLGLLRVRSGITTRK
jgi:hypothetical protein